MTLPINGGLDEVLRAIGEEVAVQPELPRDVQAALDAAPAVAPRLFRAEAVLCSRADISPPDDCPVTFENPVPVRDVTGHTVGFADVRWEGDQLLATVTIPYGSPERLTIEAEDQFLSPATFVDLARSEKVVRELLETPRRPFPISGALREKI